MENNKRQETELEKMMFSHHHKITIRAISITVTTLAIMAGGGYLLDRLLNSHPIALIIGTVLAFPTAQYITYRTFRRLTKKIADQDTTNQN